jgi:deoxycytidylate deaminase
MEIAKNEALKSTMNNKHGAVIFKGRELISIGYNQNFNREIYKNKYSIHAEIDALMKAIKAKKDIRGATMIVVRIAWKHNNSFIMSKPCDDCANAIIKNEIGTVFYTDWRVAQS